MSRHCVRVIVACAFVLLVGQIKESLAETFGVGASGENLRQPTPKDVALTLEQRTAQEQAGRELFVRDWLKSPPGFESKGDGLGPMFNDVSCVACHQLGGIGGAGGKSNNVLLLHLTGAHGSPLNPAKKLSERQSGVRRKLHPGFANGATSAIVHRYQTEKNGSAERYQQWLARRLPESKLDQTSASKSGPFFPGAKSQTVAFNPLKPLPGTYRAEGLPVRLTERNTPSLFGAGLIDTIPDAAIVEMAERQKRDHAPLISGRVPQTATGEIGRFGWRGQVATLQEFVMTACAVELGLTVPNHEQSTPVNFVAKPDDDQRAFVNFRGIRELSAELDLTQEQCNALTTYVASLPAPRTGRATLDEAKSIERGKQRFHDVGCAICHVPNLGPASNIFSDLLLHDMGPGMSDPLPAMPELDGQSMAATSGYFGVISHLELVKNITTNIHQEWRTPPLWGVADSFPYMHDGRAATLEDAIRMHAGEGQRAAEEFRSLKPTEQDDLLNFLLSLTVQNNVRVRLRLGPGQGAVIGPGGFVGGGFF